MIDWVGHMAHLCWMGYNSYRMTCKIQMKTIRGKIDLTGSLQ